MVDREKEKEKDEGLPARSKIVKEGWVKRRNGRMHRWTNRYFLLHDNKLTYKLDQDSNTVRGTFELVPGTVLTDITEESIVKMKSNKLYSFWVVNPGGSNEKGYESDDEDDRDGEAKVGTATVSPQTETPNPATGAVATTTAGQPANRNLQNIVRNELENQKRKKVSAEEQVELHHAHDSNVTQGAMVAAVAVGGVVVGAMTMVS